MRVEDVSSKDIRVKVTSCAKICIGNAIVFLTSY